MYFEFAIIGAGLTGTAMLSQLVKKVRDRAADGHLSPSKIAVLIFEKQDVFGPGFPHNERFALPFHVNNMCAFDMGVLDGKPDDFQNWVTFHWKDLRNRFSWFAGPSSQSHLVPDGCNHYPRAIMGEYLKAVFQESVRTARALGVQLCLYPASEVVNLLPAEKRVHLTVRDLSSNHSFSKEVDRVLLATGHWPRKSDHKNYFSSPWPAVKLLRTIPKGEKVAIIGTSLSAIETALTLTSEGAFERTQNGDLVYIPAGNPRNLILYSRNGHLPRVRGRSGRRKNRFLHRENLDRLLVGKKGLLELREIFELLNADLEDAYGRSINWKEVLHPRQKPADLLKAYLRDARHGDGPKGELIWQTVLHGSFDVMRDIYLNLTLEEKMRFDKEYTSVFFAHAAPQPYVNAEKLLALMNAGIVAVKKLGSDYRMVSSEDAGSYEFIYRDSQGGCTRDSYRYVVDARGQSKNVETDPSELTGNLLASGIIQIEEIRNTENGEADGKGASSDIQSLRSSYKTGSILIDPETNLIIQKKSGNTLTRSSTIYAVGPMTRGQIIDASMARSIVELTSRIADHLIEFLDHARSGFHR